MILDFFSFLAIFQDVILKKIETSLHFIKLREVRKNALDIQYKTPSGFSCDLIFSKTPQNDFGVLPFFRRKMRFEYTSLNA